MPLGKRRAAARSCSSGYTDSALQPDSPEAFIQKPFTPAALLGRVQLMLRANPTGTPN